MSTNSIVTDGLGFTWVSTRLGLQRYNGNEFENITPIIGTDTFWINTPTYLFGLQNGSIWISWKKGLLEYDPVTNSFKELGEFSASENSFFAIVPLMQTTDGIWCMQENRGIVEFRNGESQLIIIDSSCIPDINLTFNTDDILNRKIISTNGKFIFIRIPSGRILQINALTHRLDYFSDFKGEFIGFACDQSRFYCQTTVGLYSYSIFPHLLIHLVPIRNYYNDILFVGCVELSGNNSLLIGFNGMLDELDTSLQFKRQLTTMSKELLGSGSPKHQIYIDRMNRIWLLTNNGILLLRNSEVPFEHYFYPGSKMNSTRCVYYDRQSHIVLSGCVNMDPGLKAGLRLFDTLSDPIWQTPLITRQMGTILGIVMLDDPFFLVTTGDAHGWYLANIREKRLSGLLMNVDESTKKELNSIQWINNLQSADDSTVYAASPNNVFRCVFRRHVLVRAERQLPLTEQYNNSLTCFLRTTDLVIWAGSYTGIIYRIKQNKISGTYKIKGGYTVRCFAEDSLKHIWVGTDRGLYVFSESGDLIKSFFVQSGFFSDFIYAILPVGRTDSVFVSSNMGISFVPFNGTIKNYTKEFGLQGNEFDTESAAESENGKLFFGGVNGINAFQPGNLSTTRDTAILNITRLVVNGSYFNHNLTNWIGDTILLNYDQNHIQMDLAALGLFNTDEYTYSYRLNGFEKTWQSTHQPTAIRYTITPGTYGFEVKWSPILSPETVFYRKFVIILRHPWWQSWWFIAAAISCLTAILSLIIWQYNHRKYAQKIKEMQVKQEIQHERERISRDLHDNLGAYAAAIAANLSRIRETDRSLPMMEELHHNSTAIVTQLNDTIWALNREAILLTSISDRFKVFLQKIGPSYSSINIQLTESIDKDLEFTSAHAFHLFRIMQEAVNNGLRHSHCNNLTISIESSILWSVSIIDDGNGLGKNLDQPQGNGLRNMKLRASEAGWEIIWDDEIPHGTRIRIQALQRSNGVQ
jgi:signal transduction histidine kinase